jgi:hypothetical protein
MGEKSYVSRRLSPSEVKKIKFKDSRIQTHEKFYISFKRNIDFEELDLDQLLLSERIGATSAKIKELEDNLEHLNNRISIIKPIGHNMKKLVDFSCLKSEKSNTPPKTFLTTIAHFCINPEQLDDALACLDEIYPRTVRRCGSNRAAAIYRWNVACLILGHNKNRLLKGLAIIGGWCGLPTLANLFKQLF